MAVDRSGAGRPDAGSGGRLPPPGSAGAARRARHRRRPAPERAAVLVRRAAAPPARPRGRSQRRTRPDEAVTHRHGGERRTAHPARSARRRVRPFCCCPSPPAGTALSGPQLPHHTAGGRHQLPERDLARHRQPVPGLLQHRTTRRPGRTGHHPMGRGHVPRRRHQHTNTTLPAHTNDAAGRSAPPHGKAASGSPGRGLLLLRARSVAWAWPIGPGSDEPSPPLRRAGRPASRRPALRRTHRPVPRARNVIMRRRGPILARCRLWK